MHIFYTPDISTPVYTLNEQESKHCTQVLRMVVGDSVLLVDGVGGKYLATITTISKKQVQLTIDSHEKDFDKRSFHLHIAMAPTKNIDRVEWFMEKATEVGIDEFSFVLCDRSERKVVKVDRLEKVVTSAVKQSIKAYHPKVNDILPFKKFIQQFATVTNKYIAHCEEGEKTTLKLDLLTGKACLVLIGPEGDFSPQEIEIALKAGFKGLSLGKSRLRTETAALATCFEANYLNQ